MNGETPKTRYHAEVKINIQGRDARVNCFADTLAEIFNDIATVLNQYPSDWKNPARRDIANAELKANQAAPEAEQTGEIPVCQECGTDEFMELIPFTDKRTGEPRQEWKCQQCQKWHWPNGRGR